VTRWTEPRARGGVCASIEPMSRSSAMRRRAAALLAFALAIEK
jgi:hypothetical protein